MTTTRRPHRAGTLLAATVLALAGCTGDDPAPTETPDDTAATTTTVDPQAQLEEATAQVLDLYQREIELRYEAEDEELGEEAREVATYSWIDDRNAATRQLRGGGRELDRIEATIVGHQVVGEGIVDDALTLNVCLETRWDYREADGTVIDDPDDVVRGAEQITAMPDAPGQWKLTRYENGDSGPCGYEDTGDDSSSTTETP